MQPVVIIGAGGLGREVADIIDAANEYKNQYDLLGYIIDPEYGSPGTMINDKPVLGGFDWLNKHCSEVLAICAVGPTHHRYKLIQRAKAVGCRFFSLVHPKAILTRWVRIGEGAILTAGCVLTNQINVGNHVLINLGCTVGHDTILEDFVTLSPGAHISGSVAIREGTYIGTGASIIEKLEVGEWSTIGAGSVVVKPVPANTTSIGVPARVIKEHQTGWQLL